MRPIVTRAALAAVFLVASLATALPHGDDEHMDMDMDMHMNHGAETSSTTPQPTASAPATSSPMSYFVYEKHSGTIMAHIALMIVGWCFILPAGE